MAARLRPRHQDEVRQKIQASQIINRLQAYFNGEVDLSAGQIQTARILLDKSIGNAPQEQIISGNDEAPLIHKVIREIVDPAK